MKSWSPGDARRAAPAMFPTQLSANSTTSVGRSTGGPWNDVHPESSDRSRKATSSAKGTSEPRGGRSSTCGGIRVGFH